MLGLLLLSALLPSAAAQANLKITVNVQSLASAGSRVTIGIITSLGGTLVNADITSAHVWGPPFRPPPIALPAPTRFATGHFVTSWAVPENATLGLYFVHVLASSGTTSNEASAPIRITAGDPDHLDELLHQTFVQLDALEGFLVDFRTGVGGDLTDISNDIAALKASLSALSSNVSSLSGSVAGVSAKVDGLKSDTSAVRSDVAAGVGSLTTLVYIAIALSIITLILQARVLTRKQ